MEGLKNHKTIIKYKMKDFRYSLCATATISMLNTETWYFLNPSDMCFQCIIVWKLGVQRRWRDATRRPMSDRFL